MRMPSSPLVSVSWLRQALRGSGRLRVVDSTVFVPNTPFAGPVGSTGPRAEFERAHIPGSFFWDLDGTSETDFSKADHNLPIPEIFRETAASAGITPDTTVVCYDQFGVFASPRLWWTLRAFGHPDCQIKVLDGGLPSWVEEGGEIADGPSFQASPLERLDDASRDGWGEKAPGCQWNFERALQFCRAKESDDPSETTQFIDVRSTGRFLGTAPEPRPETRRGHMLGSLSLSFLNLSKAGSDGSPCRYMRGTSELKEEFDKAGISTPGNMVFSCGSGLTACMGCLALFEIGCHDLMPVYEGSWLEWGGRHDTPIVNPNEDAVE